MSEAIRTLSKSNLARKKTRATDPPCRGPDREQTMRARRRAPHLDLTDLLQTQFRLLVNAQNASGGQSAPAISPDAEPGNAGIREAPPTKFQPKAAATL